MSKSKLRAALNKTGGVQNYINPTQYETMSDEQIREEAFKHRQNQDGNITDKMAFDNKRNSLLKKAGFDWVDIEELSPHPDNVYHITDEDIQNLAGLIYISKETQPLVVQETKDGLQIIDGERRWRAHKLLSEMYGETWRMVPVRVHALDSLSKDEVNFILHSNNAGQREKTPSEKAMGFAVIADQLIEWRKSNPALKGVKTKTLLAQHFGVSERTAIKNLSIGKNLIDDGKELLDKETLTMNQAESISRFDDEQQEELIEVVKEHNLSSEQINELIALIKTTGSLPEEIKDEPAATTATAAKKVAKSTDAYLKTAKNALRKAKRCNEPANLVLIGEIRQLIRELDEKQNI